MTQTTTRTERRTDAEAEQSETRPQGARYGSRPSQTAVEGGTVEIEIDQSHEGTVDEGVEQENIQRGPEQAVLSGDEGGFGDNADKRAATHERHAEGYTRQSHIWGSTFNPADADDASRFLDFKELQNTGKRHRGESEGRHTNEDARIFRRFRSIAKGLELPSTIRQRAGRLLHEVRELPRKVCHDYGSELTIAACVIKAADETDYSLAFDRVYRHLPKHPERTKEQARHRFEKAQHEVQNRHQLRHTDTDDPVVSYIRFAGDALELDPLAAEVAESLYESLGDGPTVREEAHSYGKTPPSLAGGYVHAVASKLPDQDQESLSTAELAEVLNLSTSAVSAPSYAIRETVSGTSVSLPAFAGIESYTHGRMVSTAELIGELQRLADELGKTPTTSEMDEHGDITGRTYQNRFDGWNNAIKAAGLTPNRASPTPSE